MFVYWAIFAVLSVGSLLNNAAHRSRILFVLCAAVPTVLMIGLRWKIGPDWQSYRDIYAYNGLFSFSQAIGRQDPGFVVLNVLLRSANAPFWVLNSVCGLVFVAGLTAFCWRQPNPWLAFLVAFPYLVIVVAMSGDRQSLALGVLFFALNAFELKKLTLFVALTLVAALFHGSVILFIPLGLLSYSRTGLQRVLLLSAVGLLGLHFFVDVFGVYAGRYSTERLQSTGVAYRLAMNTLAAVIFLIFKRRFALEEHEQKLWRNVAVCTLALLALLPVVPSSTAVDRFLLYLFPLQFVVLSRTPGVLAPDRHQSGQVTLTIVAYAAAVQAVFLIFGTFASYYVPYRSVLDGTFVTAGGSLF